MKSKLIHAGDLKRWAVVFDSGDEVIAGLKQFASANNLGGSSFTAIGAFSGCLLGYFNIEKRDYKRIPITEQVEVLSLIGDVTVQGDHAKIHAHVVVGKSDGTAHGGHLLEARVKPTLEVILTEAPRHLHRALDPVSGLALIEL